MAARERRLPLPSLVLLAGLVVAVPATIGSVLILAGAGLLAVGPGLAPWMADTPLAPPTALLLVGLIALAGVGWLTAIAGLGLYVFLPTRSYVEAVRGYASYRTVLACLALAIVGYLIVFLPIVPLIQAVARPAEPPANGVTPTLLVASIVGTEVALLLVVYFRIVRPGVVSWPDMGLTLEDLPRRLGTGLLAGVALLVAAVLVEQVLQRFGVRQNQAEMFAAVQSASPNQFLALVLAASVLAPFAEEIFFRGYVFTGFIRERTPLQAYLFSAALFSVVHFNLAALAPIFVIGLVLAFVYHRTKTLVPAVVAHGLNNLIALSALYFGTG